MLDLRPLIEQLGDQIGLGGRLQQRLGPDAGQIVIMHSDQLDAAQKGVKVMRALSIFLAIAVSCCSRSPSTSRRAGAERRCETSA